MGAALACRTHSVMITQMVRPFTPMSAIDGNRKVAEEKNQAADCKGMWWLWLWIQVLVLVFGAGSALTRRASGEQIAPSSAGGLKGDTPKNSTVLSILAPALQVSA